MRPLKNTLHFWLLELVALLLTAVQYAGGVRTDEAKYLLSIPYPHPPLVRSVLAFTAAMPLHELFWRFVFASVLLQCVRLFVDLGRVLTAQRRLCLAASWLLSSAVILQSGSIVMAALVAAFGAVLVWLALHPTPSRSPAAIACLWLASLFTAYQAVLFLPLVISSLWRTSARRSVGVLYVLVPLLLLTLYTMSSPHALLTMVQVSVQDAAIPLPERLMHVGWIWILGGAAALSVVGTLGILSSSRVDLVLSFGLVLGFVFLTSQEYYAILFTPLLMGGMFLLLCRRRLHPGFFMVVQAACLVIILWRSPPLTEKTMARAYAERVQALGLQGTMLIDGPFGHEWQYESTLPLRRFSQDLSTTAEEQAVIFVCTKSGGCDDDVDPEIWVRMPEMPLPTWVRR